MRKSILLTGLALCAATAHAQCFKEGYVDWGYGGTQFAGAISSWQTSKKVSADDNFFISRIKPKARFRNEATQVRALTEANDKKLLAWVPINNPLNNAIPDSKFDSEVFNMWSYVTHYGDWTAALGRVPAAFLDVAHKNGVGVSGVAGIPNAALSGDWKQALSDFANLDHKVVADFLKYYGNDGLGYNSEFTGGGQDILPKLRELHAALVKASTDNPVFENIWYDGTSDKGTLMFDQGLSRHNIENFGKSDNKRTSLFFNYNWNEQRKLDLSVNTANKFKRSPLDLYAGMNMQGGEPKRGQRWTMLKDYPLSIGLWGAHQQNMFWESRNEQGSTDDTKQRTYMLRTERWFTGGTRNPANCPAINDNLTYALPNTDFHGMSSMMSARSSLCWDLTEEPFVTFFNLGNGKFFNWKGARQNNNQWYNIGIQDYLPTWRYWFSNKLLGKTAADVPANGLDAEFIWDDAYVGGSCMRVFGSTDNEYLHLFKTKYAMQAGDVITFRYKLMKGAANANLVLTAETAENVAINEDQFNVLTTTTEVDEDVWVEKTFTVGDELAGKNLALVALHFQNAKDLNLYFGEFSIVRGATVTPAAPQIVSSDALAYHKDGVDGKLIFNMENNKPAGTPCYNVDVKTSLFKIYAQQEGGKPVCMGATTSWAALIYNAPVDFKLASQKVRFGVSAVSLDTKQESPITWGEYNENEAYTYNDDITVSKTTIKPNEAFEMAYADVNHEEGTWKLVDASNATVFEGSGRSVSVNGIGKVGSYDLILNGKVAGENGQRVDQERRFTGFVQVSSETVGALPEIYTLTANNQEADIQVAKNEVVNLAYTGRRADGACSKAVDLSEERFGVDAKAVDAVYNKPFTVSAWLKINALADGETQLLAIANKKDGWPKTDWGWLWSNCDKNGYITSFTFRGSDASSNKELRYKFGKTKLPVGTWFHLAYAFSFQGDKMHCDFFVNGVKQECTQWNRSTDNDRYNNGEPGFEGDLYSLGEGMVISFGGNANGRAGINGAIDNFMVWNKALNAEEVKTAMGDITPSSAPAGLSAAWDLETAPADGKMFAAIAGAHADAKAGLHNMENVNGDPNSGVNWIAPKFTSGCPLVAGTAFPVTTTSTWKAKKGVVTEAQGNSEAGSAKVTYAKDGVYDVTLTLENSLGSATKTFKSITVGTGATGIEDATLEGTEVSVENGMAIVNFASAGNYNVRVYNAAGQLVASKAQFMTEGQHAQIALGHAGVYVLQIEKDGQTLANVKLLNK